MATNTSNFNFQGIGIVNLVDGDSGGPGCMDQNAKNYNPAATEDDDSCLYDEGGPGCTNPNAFNYNPAATIDDDSCVFDPGGSGCTDATAVNYNPTATIDDGSCVFYQIPGCTDPDAANYDPYANVEDGSCEYLNPDYGCIDINACNYNPDANTPCDEAPDDLEDPCTECHYLFGCTDPLAPNYDGSAICDDGSCITDPGGEWGCTDVDACNYDPLAVNDDESCDYECLGCMDDGEKSLANGDDFDSEFPGNEACNYNLFATQNDGSCVWDICCPDDDYINFDGKGCCSYDESYCSIIKIPGCMDDGNIDETICVMDPFKTYEYELPDGSIINADAKGIIAATGDDEAWPGCGNGDHPDFVNQSNCTPTLYTNNGDGDPSASGIGSFTPGTRALNYNSNATVDDGSCEYKEKEPVIKGCLDDKACNYDCVSGNTNYPCNDGVTVAQNEEICIYKGSCEDCNGKCTEGCVQVPIKFCESLGFPWQGFDKGCCAPIIEGCMDANAKNFNCATGSTSTTPCTDNVNVQDDPSSCIFKDVYGCTDPNADNYDSSATIDDGSCKYIVLGCMDKIACNHDPLATDDDGSCCYGVCGCTDPTADNYESLADCDDGSCTYPKGCTDPKALNYDPLAIVEDGCVYCPAYTQNNTFGGCEIFTPNNINPMDGMIDSGVRGKIWGTAAGNAPGDPFVCLAWDYFVSNGLQDEIIGKHYMVKDQVELNNSGSIYSTKCIADPKDFGGEERVIIPTGPIRIYNEPEPINAVPGDAVYTGQPNQTTINDVIHWLNTNVANVFNNTMSYSEINQEYRNQNPQIEWDTTYGGVSPIVVGQHAKTCCLC